MSNPGGALEPSGAALGSEPPREDLPAPTPPAGRPSGTQRSAARLRPQELAARRGDVREGLDWLGRPPETRATPLYRLVRGFARLVFQGLLRMRAQTTGLENLPPPPYLVVAAVHRGWIDPLAILAALPVAPRAWFLASGPSLFGSRWKEAALRRVGGVLPVWRGGVGVDQHVASAEAVLAAGGIFVLLAEGGISGPPDRPAHFRDGASLIALRTGAVVVPMALAGTGELYVGKRMAVRILAPTTARELLGAAEAAGGPAGIPEPTAREEVRMARIVTDRLVELLAPAVAEIYPATVDPPSRPRRLRRLTWLFLPGTGDR